MLQVSLRSPEDRETFNNAITLCFISSQKTTHQNNLIPINCIMQLTAFPSVFQITLILMSALVLQALGKQSTSNNGVKLKRNSGQRTVRLDPLLRKALLRALTELEREAQEKIKQEEAEKLKEEEKDVEKRGNHLQESDLDTSAEEIQRTADTKYPTAAPIVNSPETDSPPELTTTTVLPEITEPPVPVTIKDTFFFHTPTPVDHDFTSPSVQETKKPEATLSPPDIETNLISEPKTKENLVETTDKPDEITTLKTEVDDGTSKSESEKTKSSDKDTEVELFKAPLVAAFTLHQDSRGTPKSVVPLIRPQQPQRNFFQQQNFFQRQQQLRQQQQFIPSVTITPLSQPNNLNNQAQRSFGSTSIPSSTAFPSTAFSSTAFPPLSSNSLIPNNFQPSIIPSQNFEVPSTASPLRNNHGFGSTPFGSTPAPFITTTSFATTAAPFASSTAPPRNFSPGSTVKPQSEFGSDVSIVQSHVFNLPSPTPDLSPPRQQQFNHFNSQFNIPQVTLPLQNEPRFPLSFNQNPVFFERQKAEQNRLRFLEEQKRQAEQARRNKAAELRQEGFGQLQQQRQEPLDFQRSVGFSFEITPKPIVNRLPQQNSPFVIQQSQTIATFEDIETRNRVNRQEGFGSTGNFGFNRPVNQIPQFPKDQRGFQNNQFQQFNNFAQLQQYRTIPDEHYRALQANRFQQFQQFPQNNFQFRQPFQFQPQSPPVTKQLENLLLQSGVADGDASRQEDLNIVSKVLALNHERSDTGFPVNRRFSRTTPQQSGKGLLVGEISETSFDSSGSLLKWIGLSIPLLLLKCHDILRGVQTKKIKLYY